MVTVERAGIQVLAVKHGDPQPNRLVASCSSSLAADYVADYLRLAPDVIKEKIWECSEAVR